MKKIFVYLLMALFAFSALAARPVLAQTETPTGPLGEVLGTVINSNTGKVVTETLDVMLHVLDQNLADKDMKHGKSQPDGTFVFTKVAFDANTQFAVMATFNGVTYISKTAPADMSSLQVAIDVPVYEITKDLSTVQIDQMHVLFNLSEDGLETKEIYILSNTGQRTVKDAFKLDGDKSATLKFALPNDADYIFFKPDDQDRFIKLNGAFADTYPILPGNQISQIMTSYLVPYLGERIYTYTAPVNTGRINLLVPDRGNLSLRGSGLVGPESMTLQDGTSYQVYTHPELKAGQTVDITITGTISSPATNKTAKNWIAMGAAFFGFLIVGAGIWWWRKSDSGEVEEEESAAPADEPTLAGLIEEIARLDETYEQQGLSGEEYQHQRKALMQKAKQLL